jgi:vacuolar-type H+-ATPase subunit C/Vma6
VFFQIRRSEEQHISIQVNSKASSANVAGALPIFQYKFSKKYEMDKLTWLAVSCDQVGSGGGTRPIIAH